VFTALKTLELACYCTRPRVTGALEKRQLPSQYCCNGTLRLWLTSRAFDSSIFEQWKNQFGCYFIQQKLYFNVQFCAGL